MSHISRFGKNRTEFRANRPLSNDEMMRAAPSIFANAAHESRSARYTYVPTVAVLDGLRREGFEPFMVAQSRSRIEGKAEFTKHMIRMRRADLIATSGEAPEIILVNSHDGTSAYQLIAGMIRFACANGLVCASSLIEDVRVAHKGDIVRDVIEGAFSVVSGFDQVRAATDSMKALTLSSDEQRVFASAALTARFGTVEERTDTETGRVTPIPVTVERALSVRRIEDRSNDLWTTFNRLQETTVRGGDRHAQLSAQGRRGRTRAVTGISQNVALNRALWELAEGMRAIKEGGSIQVAA
jgi:hypothetical protein